MNHHSESSRSSTLMILDNNQYSFFPPPPFSKSTPRKEKPLDWKAVARSSRDNCELETSTIQISLLPRGGHLQGPRG